MTDKFNKLLSENLNLDEEAKKVIQEEWNNKLSEAREEQLAELREEYAQKFTHDKKLIVESMEKFLNKELEREIRELAEDKKSLANERVAYKTKIKEHAKLLNGFVNQKLAEEVKNQRSDRDELKKGLTVLENFVLKQLAEEIKEFHADKKSLQEQRVKLVREGREELRKAKQEFIKRAAGVVNESIESTLRGEITQLKEDINIARENEFGRNIFEAFAGTFMTSYLNENTEVSKLHKKLAEMEQKLVEAKQEKVKQEQLAESIKTKLAAARDLNERQKTMNRLLSPLGNERKRVMVELLEGVQTRDLERKFDQYLPAVLNESGDRQHTKRQALKESVKSEKTGNRAKNSAQDEDNISQINEIKRLAGL